jgi:hypothetical protein
VRRADHGLLQQLAVKPDFPSEHVTNIDPLADDIDQVERLDERLLLKSSIEIPLCFTFPIEVRAERPMRKSSEPQNEMLKTTAQASK